jgi:hypothetical protein
MNFHRGKTAGEKMRQNANSSHRGGEQKCNLFVRRLWLGPVLTSVITTSQEAEIRRIVA